MEFLDLLRRFHAETTPHSGRHLIDHLQGTRRLLHSWGNPPEVCRAGLFHSIYGTNIFTFRSASFADRPVIRAAIGETAERLAYLFCVVDRPAALLEAALEGRTTLADIVHGGEITLQPGELNALLEIELANFLEQPDNRDDLALILALVEKAGPVVSPPALSFLRQAVAGELGAVGRLQAQEAGEGGDLDQA